MGNHRNSFRQTMRSVLLPVSGHLLVSLSGLILSHAAFADTTTCVSNIAELQSALSSAASYPGTELQRIQIVHGTYDFSGSQVSSGTILNEAPLALEGGYENGCGSRVAGAQTTTLDGISYLWLASGADLTVKDLTIVTVAGIPPLASGVGMDVPGKLILDRLTIQGAVPDGYDYMVIGGASIQATNLAISSSNHVNCALLPYPSVMNGGLLFLSHITVSVEQGSGVCFDSGWDSVQMVNSIVETHVGNYDVLVNTTAPVGLQHNIYGARVDTPGAQITVDSDTLWGWNIFNDASNGDIRPTMTLGFPAVDAGDQNADGVIYDVFDNPRLYNRPDIGAYESDRIFGATFI